jgi:hypothetical protein
MAGALLGCVTKQKPPGKALDAAYIEREASRLANIASGEQQPSFPYPDLLKWKAPRAQLDTVGRLNGSVILSGLGGAHPHGDLIELPGRQDQALQWFELEFGQSVLARRRKELPSLARNALAGSSRARVDEAEPKTQQLPGMAGEKDSIKSTGKSRIRARKTPPRVLTLDQALEQVERSGYKPTLIGSLILEVSKASEQEAAELARRIAVAWKTERSRKDRNPPGM